MKTQLTTFILFAAMTTGCGADDLVALDNTQVMEIPAVEQVAVIRSHDEDQASAQDERIAETNVVEPTIELVETNDGETAPTVMAPQQFTRMDETNEETAREVDDEYEFIVPEQNDEDADVEDACGNGIVDADEQCDDGNDNDDDWCSNECVSKTEFKQAEAVLIDEDFTFGLGGFDFCSPLRCTGDNCPTVSAGAVQLNAADNYLCLPSIQVNARGRLVEHAFTINANDALHRIVIRDADADAWRVVLNLRDGLIEYQSPQTGERTAISVDMDNTEGEQFFRVIFDSNAQATYIVLGDTFLGELPFNAPRVDNVMFSTHGAQSQDNAPSLDDYRVARFN